MKKDVPFLIRINSEYDPVYSENIMMFRYGQIIENQYAFPKHDFYSYCGILIKQNGLENLPDKFRESILVNGELIPEIRFEFIRYKINDSVNISQDEMVFFRSVMLERIEERKRIIKKEISKTNLNGKILNSIKYSNSEDYKLLIDLTKEFTDITLLDWFIPIVLKFDRLIHIFIKHVEETKFAEGQFKERTYFTYKPTEIWILIKTIIKRETDDIKDHFIENRVKIELKKEGLKDYYRGYANPIVIGEDRFVLRIDKYGFIMQFHQL